MKRREAFTLIELLVVIAIIALLVSILMPSLQKAKELAKDVVCRSHQHNVAYGLFLYCETYDDQFPYGADPPDWQGDVFTNNLAWDLRIGIVPEDEIPENFADTAVPGYPNQKEICEEGFIDFHWHNRKEGTFKCPAAGDQVIPRVPLYFEWPTVTSTVPGKTTGSPTMAGGWGNCFSLNGNLSRTFKQEDRPSDPGEGPPYVTLPECVKTTDVQGSAVMIGDGNIRTAGASGIFVTSIFLIGGEGRLGPLGDTDEERIQWWGPWPQKVTVDPWPMGGPNDPLDPIEFYGHPGETANLTYTDGHVSNQKTPDPDDWMIE